MGREETTRALRNRQEELRTRFGVRSLRLFGSTARDEAGPQSDVDILVDFDTAPSLIGFLALRSFLEDLLGAPVDLVTEGRLRERARTSVVQDAVRVAESCRVPRGRRGGLHPYRRVHEGHGPRSALQRPPAP